MEGDFKETALTSVKFADVRVEHVCEPPSNNGPHPILDTIAHAQAEGRAGATRAAPSS
jgi:hypothetical protein